ncbi:MAG: phytanoyl-CoA dioxygenase [Ilumatobacteraceae bacterium]|nr:phytanoyl-CoA dioxygenase [Ilumatobacteraceae bacterium]
MQLVTAQHVETYRQDGAVLLRGVITQATVDSLAQGLAANMASPSKWANDYTSSTEAGRFFDDYVNWQRISQYQDAALHGVLPTIAAALMNTSQPRFFHEHVLVKEAGTATPTPWHHDDPYYGIDGLDNVSLWIPLDDVPESIALRCLIGSHKWGERYIPNRFIDQSPYANNADGFLIMPTAQELEMRGEIRTFAALPGDIVAFHFRTLHSAPGTMGHNSSRRVISLRYLGDDARWATRPWKTSPPLEANGLLNGDLLDIERFPLCKLS